MKDKELESLFRETPELEPRAELKNEILARAESELLEKNNTKRKIVPLYKRMKMWIPVAACLVLAVLVLGGLWGLNNEQYQTIYIDVNPSLSVSFNRFDEVSCVEYLNEDAQKSFENIELEGLEAEVAMETIISTLENEGYFENEANILLSAENDSLKMLEKLKNHAEKIKGNQKYKVSTQSLTKEEKEEAKENGVSPGKYRTIMEIIELEPGYTVEELNNLTMAELNALYKSLTKPNKKGF